MGHGSTSNTLSVEAVNPAKSDLGGTVSVIPLEPGLMRAVKSCISPSMHQQSAECIASKLTRLMPEKAISVVPVVVKVRGQKIEHTLIKIDSAHYDPIWQRYSNIEDVYVLAG